MTALLVILDAALTLLAGAALTGLIRTHLTVVERGLIGVVLGLLVTFGEKLPVRLGHLPGDIVIRGKNTTFYFPLVTSLLLSVLLSFVMWLLGRR